MNPRAISEAPTVFLASWLSAPSASAAPVARLTYHGGRVISNVKVRLTRVNGAGNPNVGLGSLVLDYHDGKFVPSL